MMINKRLIGTVSESKKYIAGNVAAQWCSLAAKNLGSTLQNTFAAGNRVLDILEETPAVQEVADREKTAFESAVAKNVSFSYGAESILEGVSLELPKGQVIGIVGKSGSGKSTLLKLFMRFWEAGDGSVEISGRDIAGINTVDLREMESFMTQETHLFHDSIRSNLRIVSEMIALYCRRQHGKKNALCPECAALAAYARQRSDKCPFMETKTFCSNCKVHCYKNAIRRLALK